MASIAKAVGTSMLPTRKWWAALITALAAFAVNWITSGAWNKTLAVAAVGIIAQSLIAYLVPNQVAESSAPTGSSPKAPRSVTTP